MVGKVQKIGNSLMVTIPKPLAGKLRLVEGDEVSVVKERKESAVLKIRPVRRKR